MSELNGLVKRVRKIMRKDNGVDGDAQRINQLVWMLFLKVYDELKESNEYEIEIDNYKSIIPEKYRWRNWAVEKRDEEGRVTADNLTGDELVDFINNGLFPTLRDLPVDETTPKRSAIVKYVFSRLHNYMINGTLIRQVINELNAINFDEYEDRHLFNEIYESILQELQNAGSSGEFYTPRAVTDFMAEILDPKPGEKIADFACGTGGFLVSAINHMLKTNNSQATLDSLQDNIIGCECKPLPYLLCVTNMLLNGTDGSNIRYGSSLSKNVFDYTENDKVDVVLMNPPFGGEIAPGEDKNFPEIFRTSETANLFVCLVLYRLKQHGRVAIVLPDGFLCTNNDNTFVELKKKLMNECNLHTIIRLPNGLFYANIPTNILFFEKGEKTNGIWYYKVPLPEGYKSFSKTKPFLSEHLDCVRSWWDNRDNGDQNAYFITQDRIIESNYNLDFKNPNIIDKKIDFSLNELIGILNIKKNKLSTCIDTLTNNSANADADIILNERDEIDINVIEDDFSLESLKESIKIKILDLAISGHLVNNVKEYNIDELFSQIRQYRKNIFNKDNFTSNITFDGENYIENRNGKINPINDKLPLLIPNNWKFIRLEDYVEKITDYVASGSFKSLSDNVKYYKSKNYAILVKTQDFQNNFTFGLTYTDQHGYEFLKNSNLFGGELILSNIGSIGKAFIVPHLNYKMTLAPNSVMIKFYNESHIKWLYYYFLSSYGYKSLMGISSGTTMKKFNKTDLKRIIVPIPPLEEQKVIVEKVERLFKVLDLLD